LPSPSKEFISINYLKTKMKKTQFLLILIITIGILACNTRPRSEKEIFIETLLAKMTLEEKAGQLNLIPYEGSDPEDLRADIQAGRIGSILKSNGAAQNKAIQKIAIENSRLGIPIMFQEDVIHGYKTIAPTPLGEAASWNLDLIKKSASIAAKEATAAGIHLTYAPMVDIAVDPRWGRILEAGGEDPFLGSCIARSRVQGFQGEDLSDPSTIMACVKHFAGYGASLAGRDYNIVNFSDHELYETYLPPFQAAIDAGVGSVMCAYTAVNSIPATANKHLLNHILKEEMGFDGFLMTDWSTIPNLVKIGLAENDTIAAIMAIDAGIDMDMTSKVFVNLLPALVKKGVVDERLVNEATRKVLAAKYDLGLFNDPYAYFDETREKNLLLHDEHIEATKQMALESMVLLKNNKNTLPLSTNIKTLAIIGPFAKAQNDLLAWWSCKVDEADVTSIYDGIKKSFQNTEILYSKGCEIDSFKVVGQDLIKEAIKQARKADAVILVLGEEYWMSGEGGGTASLRLPSAQEELAEALSKVGKPVISVIVTGRPYILSKIEKSSTSLLQAWMPGTTGGLAVAEIISGKFNPCGKLPVTFPVHEGQVPIYYNYRKTSHNFNGPDRYTTKHLDIPHEPLYPFGYGLSYTSYTYGDIKLSTKRISKNETLQASIDISNKGSMDGIEIVQLYIRDKVCSITRPVKELKGFDRVKIKAGETITVSFDIDYEMLQFYNNKLVKTAEPGDFTLFIGPNSADVKEVDFTLL